MMFRKRLAFSCLVFCGYTFAADIQLMGTETHAISIRDPKTLSLQGKGSQKKQITLLSIKLSDQARSHLQARTSLLDDSALSSEINLPRSTQLEMNGVPVLDQGVHGTCVTFAATAAVDAAVYKKDEISQLCQLELGTYLERVGNNPSGWDGSLGHIVLSQMDSFGVITKTKQLSEGCAGVYQYPVYSEDAPRETMQPEVFHRMLDAEADGSVFTWYPILHVNEAFEGQADTRVVLNKVKETLNAGDRLVFGVLLIEPDLGVGGALGRHHTVNDTWVLTKQFRDEIKNPFNFFAGHEMVITGYDDDAVAVDADGEEHRGLLTLRNSWGTSLGDSGNFYMSYDYFKALVIEAHKISARQ